MCVYICVYVCICVCVCHYRHVTTLLLRLLRHVILHITGTKKKKKKKKEKTQINVKNCFKRESTVYKTQQWKKKKKI